jgi:hypothetical protein
MCSGDGGIGLCSFILLSPFIEVSSALSRLARLFCLSASRRAHETKIKPALYLKKKKTCSCNSDEDELLKNQSRESRFLPRSLRSLCYYIYFIYCSASESAQQIRACDKPLISLLLLVIIILKVFALCGYKSVSGARYLEWF